MLTTQDYDFTDWEQDTGSLNTQTNLSKGDKFIKKVDKGRRGENTGYPGGLPRLDKRIYNIQPAKMTSIVGSPKSGKTFFMLYRYILTPWINGVRNIKWFLFTLEVDRDEILGRMTSFFLFRKYGIRISSSKIFSMGDFSINEELYDKIKTVYEEEILPLLNNLEIIEDSSVSNPTGLFKYIQRYLLANGTEITEEFLTFDENNREVKRKRTTGYIKNNPNEEIFIIVDSLGLMKKEQGFSKKDNIDKWIDDYGVKLRNIYGCSIINLHHLNRGVSGVDRFKLSGSQLHPTLEDIKDTSALGETSDIVFALFNPSVYSHITDHFGYKIGDWKGMYRSLHILASRYCDMGLNSALLFDYESGTFSELPDSKDTSALNLLKTSLIPTLT